MTSPLLLPLPPRSWCFAGLCAVAALNSRAHIVAQSIAEQGAVDAVVGLFDISAIIWFAIFASLALANDHGAEGQWRAGDRWVLSALIVAIMLPVPMASAFASLAAAMWFAMTEARGGAAQRLALILFAIAAQMIFGRLFLALFSAPILWADVQLVSMAANLESSGNVLSDISGRKLIVFSGCSSVGNLSLTILAWVVVTQMFDMKMTAKLWWVVGVSLAATVALNTARLVALAYFPENFESLHHGQGAMLFSWANLLVLMGFCWLGAHMALPPQRQPAGHKGVQ